MSIEDDLADLYSQRLRTVVTDMHDTLARGGVDPHEALQMLMSGLLRELSWGAVSCEIDEDSFVHLCREAHRVMRPHAAKILKRMAKSRKK